MRRLGAIFIGAAILLSLTILGAWQSQQNFGTGGVIGPGLSVTTDIPTFNGTSGGVLQDPASCTLTSAIMQCPSALVYRWSTDTGLSRDAAGVVDVGTGAAGNAAGTLKAATLTVSTATNSAAYQTATNCASTGGTCGSAASGSVGITNPATTVTVSTTAVNANSVIIVQEDATLGTKLTATCNATLGRTFMVTTRTANTSFIITASATPAANTACLNYWIVN